MRMLHRFFIAILVLTAFSSAQTPVRAANASVTDCTNFTGAGTIADAVTTANSGGGTITFMCSGTIIFTSSLNIMANTTINANGNTVIFDETGDDNSFFSTSGIQLTLDGFTLQNGNDTFGGAISVSVGSTVTVNNSTFINNSASSSGGAIRNNGTVSITNSTFTGNSASSGGAIHNLGSLTITDSTFTGNFASIQGGVINNTVGTVTINHSLFTTNTSPLGGAVHNTNTISSQDSHYGNNDCTGNTITNTSGNTAISATGCPGSAPIALSVSALTCNNDSAVFEILAGDGDFSITGAGAGLPINPASIGLYGLVGPDTWTNIIITELKGDRQSVNIGGISCPEAVIIPPTIPTTSSVTVLGCALDSTDGVEVAGAPDDTYCRVLMKNGGVVSYSGAIPADLIGLGVVLAVDVYRLQGGATVNTFPDYARVCLAGSGRLFYMDGRNAPRVSVELATEAVDNLTCGWIPAPGTLILTN